MPNAAARDEINAKHPRAVVTFSSLSFASIQLGRFIGSPRLWGKDPSANSKALLGIMYSYFGCAGTMEINGKGT